MRVWLAEKPSFAKDLGRALGNPKQVPGLPNAWDSDGGRIVAAAGHLIELAEPAQYNPEWKTWSVNHLPIVPERWEFMYRPIAGKENWLVSMKAAMKGVSEIVIATDAGREGEYIAWLILNYLGMDGVPKKRLWSSGANAAAIKKAVDQLLDYSEKEKLAQSARVRAESDWVEGLNLTRLLTERFRPNGLKGPISVGRVQTATLALIVNRQNEIENFKPENYYDLAIDVSADNKRFRLTHSPKDEDRIKDPALARRIVSEVNGKTIVLEVKETEGSEKPPVLFESSSLQIRAYNLWGWSATHTEKISQSLYDTHKLISYPRTDGVHLEDEQWNDVPVILANIGATKGIGSVLVRGKEHFVDLSQRIPPQPAKRDDVFSSDKLAKSGADHHGIIPTTEQADLSALSEDEKKLYLLIVRQYLAQLYPNADYKQKRISWTHDERVFSATGRIILRPGWKVLFSQADEEAEADEKEKGEEMIPNLPDIPDGARGVVTHAAAMQKTTIAPPQYTEGSIIAAMRDISKVVTNAADRRMLQIAKSIGTKSTWGETIKKLRDREYIKGKGKISPTELGIDLVNLCRAHIPTLIDPLTTALLEAMLADVEKGKMHHQKAREIVQGRNVEAIRKALAIEGASLRMPTGTPSSNPDNKKKFESKPFVDFPGGSYALEVPFDDKDMVKSLGAKFNSETRKWHMPKAGTDVAMLKAKGWLK